MLRFAFFCIASSFPTSDVTVFFTTVYNSILDVFLELKLFNEQTQKGRTNFYFKNGLSLDLDPGYDAGAINQSTKLSTRLPQGSQEFAFAINAMGIDALQNARVPLEIKQNAGQAFTISIADMELPQDIVLRLAHIVSRMEFNISPSSFSCRCFVMGGERMI